MARRSFSLQGLCASSNSAVRRRRKRQRRSYTGLEGRRRAGVSERVAVSECAPRGSIGQPRYHFNALERFECRMLDRGTSWDRKRSSTKVVPKIALALPNRQMMSRFVKCCFCSRCSGNWPRRKQEDRTRLHRVKTPLSFHREFGRVASFVALWLLLVATPARADVRILASPGGEVGSYIKLFSVLRQSGQRVILRNLLLSLHPGAEQYPP